MANVDVWSAVLSYIEPTTTNAKSLSKGHYAVRPLR